MRFTDTLPFLAGLMVILSLAAFLINYLVYHYSGNDFFPEKVYLLALTILLIHAGLVLLFGANSKAVDFGVELLCFFCIMWVITLATNAIQLTPFSPIDKHILSVERYCHINSMAIVAWAQQHPFLQKILGFSYDTLPLQMSCLPLLLLIMRRFERLREYYFLLLCTALIGFAIYYFFPTTAPASMLQSDLFTEEQRATGLKFYQIHRHLTPTTNEGGLIAFPSFHTIWALLCVYLLREWKLICALLFIFNLGIICSCVVLGWHYVADVVAAFVVLAVSYYLNRRC
jgi:membrane-associated phospholipid phosphatase